MMLSQFTASARFASLLFMQSKKRELGYLARAFGSLSFSSRKTDSLILVLVTEYAEVQLRRRSGFWTRPSRTSPS